MILNHIEGIEMKENNLEQEFFKNVVDECLNTKKNKKMISGQLQDFIKKRDDLLALEKDISAQFGITLRSGFDDAPGTIPPTWLDELLKDIKDSVDAKEELKPCPFCQTSPDVSKTKLSKGFRVSCISFACPLSISTHIFPEQKEAEKAWNARASEKAIISTCGICEDYFIKGVLSTCSSCIEDIIWGEE